MRDPALILVVDDTPENRDILETRLTAQGYEVAFAEDGIDALEKIASLHPDLVLLDVMMPRLDGFEVCRRVKADAGLPFTPIILVTAKADTRDVVQGLDAGGDDYLTKPIDQPALAARVRSMLRIKALHDQVQAQTAELAGWNRTLEDRVQAQLHEIERVGRLKRFLPPQVADLIASGADDVLASHRQEIVAVMCDLRGFTAFAETGEPEDVMGLLQDYHRTIVPIVFAYEGTLERFVGDGVLIFFNDPLPCADPEVRAARMALEMRAAVVGLADRWRKKGYRIGFGVGIAQGFATIGQVGLEGRVEYSAIGTVTNLSARLCDQAADGQILLSQRVATSLSAAADIETVGELNLKGMSQPVMAFNLVGLRD
jgi:class 3 adenylate cyclase